MKSLSALCKGKYKIELDESYKFLSSDDKKKMKIWMERIACIGGGHISYYTDKIMQLWSPRPKNVFFVHKTLNDFENTTHNLLDGEAELFFPIKHFLEVCRLAQARIKRQVSPERREQLIAAGKKGKQFVKGEPMMSRAVRLALDKEKHPKPTISKRK